MVHVAEATLATGSGEATMVLFLHGFPEFWWAWRDQLPPVADAGYRAVAMDLRGYGSSDKTPRGYDPLTLAADVAGVIRALGVRDAVLVGHGWGGYVAWAAAAVHAHCVRALCAVAAPHPAQLLRIGSGLPGAAVGHLAAMQVPWIPEREIITGRYLARHFDAWTGSASTFPAPDVVAQYQEALSLWPSPHCALEYHRWLLRSRFRTDGRAFAKALRRRVDVPVLHIGGSEDPTESRTAVARSARNVAADFTTATIDGAGHFPHEESPIVFTRHLLRWLSGCAGAGADPGG
ncbi:MAG: alpha/beta fold hydrolase [Nocardioidaceae bacterium]